MKKRMAKSSARSKRREGSQKSTTSTGKTAPPSQELKELAETLKSLSTSSGPTDSGSTDSIPEHDTQNAETKLYLERCQARNLEFCETWAKGEVAGVDIIKPLSYFLIQALNTLTIEGLFSDKKTTATSG